MGILSGISGMQMGDGAGGKISLMIKEATLQFLQNSFFSYKTASFNHATISAGTVTYKIPELLQTQKYNPAGIGRQVINAKDVTVEINMQRALAYETETFDVSRLGDWKKIVGMVASMIGTVIEADLNSHFWLEIKKKFALNNGELRSQNLVLPQLQKKDVTSDEGRQAIRELIWLYTQISKKFTKSQLGVKKSQLLLIVCPEAEVTFREAFWNQPNELGARVISDSLQMKPLGGDVYYIVDNFLGQNIQKGIFRNDVDTNLEEFLGFIIHNEAIAFPWNIQKARFFDDQQNLNEVFGVKYQFGFGFLRPHLVYSITKQAPTAFRKAEIKEEKREGVVTN